MPGAVDHTFSYEAVAPRLQDEPIPVVIVDGFLGGTGALLWGNFEHYLNLGHEDRGQKERRTIFVSVGPVSSLHDRACELFYALCGGTVDYGEQHALEHGHSRYGRTNQEGLYPEWSTRRPLHFLGHSMGGPTIVKLQWLMHTGFFGTHVHPDMVLSVTAISSPFRGTQLVYILGERIDAAPAVRPLSLGTALSKIVHIISFLSPPTHSPFDFHSESRELSYRETSWTSFWKQLKKSDWAESRDAAPFDVTFEAADEREAAMEGIPNKNSFYRAYAAEMTAENWKGTRRPFAILDIFSPLYLFSRLMASFDFSSLQPQPSFMSQVATSHDGCDDLESGCTVMKSRVHSKFQELFCANDGVVPVFSQYHPFECSSALCRHYPMATASCEKKPLPGIWHVHELKSANHLSIAPLWMGSARQKVFWEELGHWLKGIDDHWQRVTRFVVTKPRSIGV